VDPTVVSAQLAGTIMPWLGTYTTDHRSSLDERWGGWYVTGRGGRHLGNASIADQTLRDVQINESNLNLTTLNDRFDARSYPSPHSDIVALLVFDHQMREQSADEHPGQLSPSEGVAGREV
jgi:hypothetical protein